MGTKIGTKKPMPLHRMTDRAKRNDDYRYQIIPLTKDVAEKTLELDGKPLPYGRSGAFMTDDSGVANAVKDKYGGNDKVDVWDVKGKWNPSDEGHKYTFSGIELPWHKYDEYGRLIREEMQDDTKNKTQQESSGLQESTITDSKKDGCI